MDDTESTSLLSSTNVILKMRTFTTKPTQDFPFCPPCFTRNFAVARNFFTEDVTILRAEIDVLPSKCRWLSSSLLKISQENLRKSSVYLKFPLSWNARFSPTTIFLLQTFLIHCLYSATPFICSLWEPHYYKTLKRKHLFLTKVGTWMTIRSIALYINLPRQIPINTVIWKREKKSRLESLPVFQAIWTIWCNKRHHLPSNLQFVLQLSQL